MELRFVIADLRTLDSLHVDALALTFFEDERPLQGIAAAVDWRLASGLSQLLIRGHMRGELSEQTLVSTAKRFPFDRTLLFGCGQTQQWKSQDASDVLGRCFNVLEQLNARSIALGLPGRSMDCVEVAQAWTTLHAALAQRTRFSEVVVLDTPTAVRIMQEAARTALRTRRTLEGLRNAIS